MIDRGIIKWQPFNSCFTSNKVLNDVAKEKCRKKLPTLSEDQLQVFEERILNAYHLGENITVKYFFNGKYFIQNGKINGFNLSNKNIIINSHIIYFKQIVDIF